MSWQPITTAPKDRQAVLLWRVDIDGRHGYPVAARWDALTFGGTWWDMNGEYTFDHVTHWMPIEAPQVTP